MTHTLTRLSRIVCFAALTAVASNAVAGSNPMIRMETTLGTMTIELDEDAAPETVANFLTYVDDGFYDGTIFHRVIANFMIQGGGYEPNMTEKTTRRPVDNEATNGLANNRGTIAMARTSDPHSATAQFFINAVDNDFLNHTAKTVRGWGYAVFGHVTDGLDVLDKIAATQTGPGDVPTTTIEIIKVERVN